MQSGGEEPPAGASSALASPGHTAVLPPVVACTPPGDAPDPGSARLVLSGPALPALKGRAVRVMAVQQERLLLDTRLEPQGVATGCIRRVGGAGLALRLFLGWRATP